MTTAEDRQNEMIRSSVICRNAYGFAKFNLLKKGLPADSANDKLGKEHVADFEWVRKSWPFIIPM